MYRRDVFVYFTRFEGRTQLFERDTKGIGEQLRLPASLSQTEAAAALARFIWGRFQIDSRFIFFYTEIRNQNGKKYEDKEKITLKNTDLV